MMNMHFYGITNYPYVMANGVALKLKNGAEVYIGYEIIEYFINDDIDEEYVKSCVEMGNDPDIELFTIDMTWKCCFLMEPDYDGVMKVTKYLGQNDGKAFDGCEFEYFFIYDDGPDDYDIDLESLSIEIKPARVELR